MSDRTRTSSSAADIAAAGGGVAAAGAAVSGPRRVALEIAVTSLAGARTALAEGADRVELCTALEIGGVTPSQGLTEAVVATDVPVHALVRARGGDFVYDDADLAVMEHEVRTLVAAGVAGVVVGALRADGSLDVDAVARLVSAARDAAGVRPAELGGSRLDVTVHRAVDRAASPVDAVAALSALGVDRVLTSGGASRARDGLASGALPDMVAAAGGVEVMAGGGVRLDDVAALVAAGVAAVHLSASTTAATAAPGDGNGPSPVSLGSAGATDSYAVTDASLVRAVRAALDAAVLTRTPAPRTP
ncbi:copper homeostasis protein CutC [Frigoribacterium sp. CFBP 13729]|uniref:copper homeostasis protein CutC n=1 Tax=Frigoribacterium sp. CFBP 13729 TaxID=2775293 RepID=UPI00177B4B82|nr:copper homeostasis protein CutC [Frigoribacterium sp. CFBP 13729]MBD8610178.1 copper homeostasis protein CutC [Frigoribacterium sp. CFBP 13729]